ncbi:post-GPI attachment to proteins factor 3-like [Corticium candelabrum]|uniref:post-GPI attachment to proteins factor 3-like n=1 Tax=Corticium candelabrum TaxID=121492 RepID=UPI002E25E748|nr:post-GPI attachment to proteins factor 3-like [Corticium candelabrum]
MRVRSLNANVCIFLFLSTVYRCRGSLGDKSWVYNECLSSCLSLSQCDSDAPRRPNEWTLSLMRWTCDDDCRYDCMHQVTADNIRYGRPVVQFYGKWPFVRVLGAQEIASAVFSAANGLAALVCLRDYRRRVSRRYKLYWLWHVNSAVSVHAWFWSTVFHCRDWPLSEHMDYFCATSLTVVQMFCQQVRIWGGRSPFRSWKMIALGLFDGLVFAGHVSYMSFVSFDYGYNLAFNISLGVMMAATWMIWCYQNYQERPYVWKCCLFLVLLSAAMALEINDFPPWWGLFDAHSLWHLATVPLTFLWYSFLVDDGVYECRDKFS